MGRDNSLSTKWVRGDEEKWLQSARSAEFNAREAFLEKRRPEKRKKVKIRKGVKPSFSESGRPLAGKKRPANLEVDKRKGWKSTGLRAIGRGEKRKDRKGSLGDRCTEWST